MSALHAFGDLLEPDEALEPILDKATAAALNEWLTEIWSADALAAVGLRPRSKALFFGPPGVGKTTLAHHLAARLGLSLLVVRPDRIVAKYLGRMQQNMAALWDAVGAAERADAPVAVFFDEFEAFARARGDESRNAQRAVDDTVSLLLQRLERHDGMVIAATNLAEGLDTAVWRRFDLRISLPLPGKPEMVRILRRYMAPFVVASDDLDALAAACVGASPAQARQLCEGVKRSLVVGPLVGWDTSAEAVFSRVLAGIAPAPGAEQPRLWRRAGADPAVKGLTWPLTAPERQAA